MITALLRAKRADFPWSMSRKIGNSCPRTPIRPQSPTASGSRSAAHRGRAALRASPRDKAAMLSPVGPSRRIGRARKCLVARPVSGERWLRRRRPAGSAVRRRRLDPTAVPAPSRSRRSPAIQAWSTTETGFDSSWTMARTTPTITARKPRVMATKPRPPVAVSRKTRMTPPRNAMISPATTACIA